jgi:hypothetical protein
MRKVILLSGLVFLLSLRVASAEPQRSERPGPAPELNTFLASLSDSLPPLAPAPIPRTACEVSKDCVCGGGYVTISCSGSVSCVVKLRSVVCDGDPTDCPSIGSCPP